MIPGTTPGGADIRIDMRIPIFVILLPALLAGCAGQGGEKSRSAPRVPTPALVSEQPGRHTGTLIEWGGIIVRSRNLKRHSELEILAFPLRRNGRPERELPPLGRFVGIRPGYIESVNFTPGRLVTVIGPILGVRDGKIGETAYRFPEMEIEDAYLWAPEPVQNRSRFRFGIGGGNRGVGVGLGIRL